MQRVRLDFLRLRPPVPLVSWLLLAFGLALAVLAGWRYQDLSDGLAREQATALKLKPVSESRRRVVRKAAVVQVSNAADREQLDFPWGELFAKLESTRPKNIGLLTLEADGRKREVILTAEARTSADMINYLEKLRRQPEIKAVALTGHTLLEEHPQQPLHFIAQLRWRP